VQCTIVFHAALRHENYILRQIVCERMRLEDSCLLARHFGSLVIGFRCIQCAKSIKASGCLAPAAPQHYPLTHE
jgi:hypothetical protein